MLLSYDARSGDLEIKGSQDGKNQPLRGLRLVGSKKWFNDREPSSCCSRAVDQRENRSVALRLNVFVCRRHGR